ncbi:gliding motility protein GldM [Bacteroidota bacterium]
MAGKKETPRQKMIGMMYLVLMALLALNVQKEVLNAFINVDEGINKTMLNFIAKNEEMYDDFYKKALVNPAKVGEYKEVVENIEKMADELYEYIFELKKKIVLTTEKGDSSAIHGHHISVAEIDGKDNMDVPAQIMVGSELHEKSEARILKNKIIEFKEYMLEHVKEEHPTVRESIESGLATHDHEPDEEHKGEQAEPWEIANFTHLPMAGVMAIMSGLQTDVRNAENEIIRYIDSQIDAGAFKVTNLEPTVIANTNYVFRGNEYKAEIFLAAFDTTADPEVFIGDFDSIVEEDGTVAYEMKGQEGVDYVTVPVQKGTGRGVYEITERSTGPKSYKGIIRVQRPDGTYVYRSFKQNYQVADANLVVSPTKMNVFYLAVDNPVDISVPGVPPDKVFPNIDNGRIRKIGGSYIVNPARTGKAIIRVSAEFEGDRKPMGSVEFRVKDVPDPIPVVGGKTEGAISVNELIAYQGILAQMPEWFDFDLKFDVTGHTVETVDKAGFVMEGESKSKRWSPEQETIFKGLSRGQKIYFNNIKAVGPTGDVRTLPVIAFRIK